jgi:hypothetical protein
MDRTAIKPLQLNLAQRLLVAMGVHDLRLVAHNTGRNESHTKTGPGRKHTGAPTGRTPKVAYGRGLENHFRAERVKAIKARLAARSARS